MTDVVGSNDGDTGHSAPAWFNFGRALLVRAATEVAATTDSDVAPVVDGDEQVAAARSAFRESLTTDTTFGILAANASLGVDDAELLALAAAAEVDDSCQQLVAEIQGHPARNRLTLGSITRLLGPEHTGARCVAPDAALRRCAFTDVSAEGPWADHQVVVYTGVLWALIGDASRDPELPSDTSPYDYDAHLDPFDSALDDEAVRSDLVIVNGTDRIRRRQAAARHSVSDRFVCARAPEGDKAWAALVCEATITGRGICIEIGDSLPDLGRRWITRAHHLAWIISAPSGPNVDELPDRPWFAVVAPVLEPTDAEWTNALGPDTPRTHRLTLDQLQQVARTRVALGGDMDAAVRRLSSGQLDRITRRIRPTHSWDDIVLDQPRLDLLHSIVQRYRYANTVYDQWGFEATPSRGLVAMFSGPSGTGKTLAAEIVAGELGLDVFKLDLSSVVSKYIGETEKNLEEVFVAASSGNMVLFFDEADSLFGKRSEVKDARDRYANIEVSYLLQRLEAYDGIVVMATNFEKNIDEAFLRRIHARIGFVIPGVNERAAIWRHNLPPSAPVGDVDVDWLAEQFELSGGSIRNASVQAAFAAAAAGTKITMHCAVLGVAREYQKMGRILKEKDFGDYHDIVAG